MRWFSALLIALALLVGAPAAAGATSPGASVPPSTSPSGVAWYHRDPQGTVFVDLYFGWTSTCPHCALARPFVATLAEEWPWLTVHSLQVDGDHAANVQFLSDLAESVGGSFEAVPIFIFGGHVEVGFLDEATTGTQLKTALAAYRAQVQAALVPGGSPSPGPTPSASPEAVELPFLGRVALGSVSLPMVTVLLAGLDAFNPCALSVLLFLLGVLVGSRSRTRILLVGGLFVLISGLSYFVFMAAWLNLFLLAGALRVVTLVAGLLALVAAAINLKDFAWFGRGPSLVIPASARPGLFGRLLDMGETTRLSAILVSAALVAVVANAYEALCTGGFPVVFTRILTLQALPTAAYYAWLALYCVIYVVPLLAIVGFVTWTMGGRQVSQDQARRLKLLSGCLMLGLGLLLVLAPERLSDMGTSLLVFGGALGVWAVLLLAERAARLRGRGAEGVTRRETARTAKVAPARVPTATGRRARPRRRSTH